MSEANWGNSLETPPPIKRGMPKWLWFCGGGCAALVVIGIVLLSWVYAKFKDSANPDKQWPKLQELVGFDERPADMTLIFGAEMLGTQIYATADPKLGLAGTFFEWKAGKNADDAREQFLTVAGVEKNPQRDTNTPVTAATVHVQGRSLPGVRYVQNGPPAFLRSISQDDASKFDGQGPCITLDLSKDPAAALLYVQLVRTSGTDPISDDEVRAYLKPFHVGPDR
jgi:hypothetical protein